MLALGQSINDRYLMPAARAGVLSICATGILACTACDVDSFRVLPYRYGYDKDQFYFVALGSQMWGHNELRVLPQIDRFLREDRPR